MDKERVMILVRGCPGAGKSTLSEMLSREDDRVVSADMYFEDLSGNYNFDESKLYLAHRWCFNEVERLMTADTPRIFVVNVTASRRDVNSYVNLAKLHGYSYVSIIVENLTERESIHNVPKEVLERMMKSFFIKL